MAIIKKKVKRRKSKKVPLTPQKKLQIKFHKQTLELFKGMGFEFIRTEGDHKEFGGLKGELDSVFVYENIILICEETIGKNKPNDHLRKKYDYYEKILTNKEEFITWIKGKGGEKFSRFDEYSDARYKIFYIYITEGAVEEDTRTNYDNFKYIDAKIFKYFLKITDSIKFSARNEFYKYLDIDFKQVGNAKSSSPEHILSAVIFPDDLSGMPKGVHLVSFVMKAKELLDCAYVFRKDNWHEEAGYYYQRLIDKKRIVGIRNFLASEKRTFIDNIIVSLPKESKFFSKENDVETVVELKDLSELTSNIIIKIPYKSNSIGIIDGQHRVFGHHEGPENKQETIISGLREKRHLFVTGLFYQKGKFNESDKRKFESKLFLEINSKQKKVNPQLLQDIQSLQDPLSPIGLAISVIKKMNNRSPFVNHFILSELDSKGIKTPTITKYALQHLVEIDENKETLFKYWSNPDKIKLKNVKDDEGEELRKKYTTFCSDVICRYFIAVKNNFEDDWVMDGNSKLMTVTSIVAFLKSFNDAIEKYQGINDIDFYQKKIAKLNMNFKDKKKFPYVSSQWPKFAEKINKIWD